MPFYSVSFYAMGTTINIHLNPFEGDAEDILIQMPAYFAEAEAHLSRFRADSELSKLNMQSGTAMPVSEWLLDSTLAACYAAEETEGLYNPLSLLALIHAGYDRSFEQIDTQNAAFYGENTPRVMNWRQIKVNLEQKTVKIPSNAALDLGGVAKGWLADRLAKRLSAYGNCVVDLGGDIAVRGGADYDFAWQIDLEDPIDQHLMGHIQLSDATIVTSSTKGRNWLQNGQVQHHIIDPRTSRPAQSDVLSTTIIHSNGILAEAYAKAVIILGTEAGLNWLNQQHGTGLVVHQDGTVYATPNFSDYLIGDIQ